MLHHIKSSCLGKHEDGHMSISARSSIMTEKIRPEITRIVTLEFSIVPLKIKDMPQTDSESESGSLTEQDRTLKRPDWEMPKGWGWRLDMQTSKGSEPVGYCDDEA